MENLAILELKKPVWNPVSMASWSPKFEFSLITYGRYQICKSFIMLFRDPDGLVLQNKIGSKNIMAVCPFNSHYRTFCLPQRKDIFFSKKYHPSLFFADGDNSRA